MAEERVYSLTDAGPQRAKEGSLSGIGYKERSDLQKWILADPDLVEPRLFVLTEEYSAWTSAAGTSVQNRLDILALDSDGRTVVVELKRDDAPTDVHLQAITYAAMVSRCTLSDLVSIHRRYLGAEAIGLADDEIAQRLHDHVGGQVSEEVLKTPRIVLVARAFPAQVTASAVWLNEMGIDVKLVQMRVWETKTDVVLTSSVVYPVPGTEEFIVKPDRRRLADLGKAVGEQSKAKNAVRRIIDGGVVELGTVFTFRGTSDVSKKAREETLAWIAAEPSRGTAWWTNSSPGALRWSVDETTYSPTGLVQALVREATGLDVPSMQGTKMWIDGEGRDLTELADLAPVAGET